MLARPADCRARAINESQMFRSVVRAVVALFLLLPHIAAAEPITLKLAYYSSDRSILYRAGIMPFVNAVNAAAKDLVHIEVYFSSELGPVETFPNLLLDGTADIALVMPGYSPQLFYDGTVAELPGLFRDAREATLVYSKLATTHVFKSYEQFEVLAAYASEPETIHSRRPIATVSDVKGLKLRANNAYEAAAIEQLGAIPVLLPINKTANAISDGTLDGAMVPPAMLFEFGAGRVTNNHFMLRTSAALMLLAMRRQSFDRLPADAQKIIQHYSGEWAALRYVETIEALNRSITDQLTSDPKRSVVLPSAADRAVARRAFDRVVKDWAGTDIDKNKQLELIRAELATLRFTDE